MATFVPDLPLEGLRGADYNPRRIDESAIEALGQSLTRLGICKPVIVSGDLLVAGHQRTRTLRGLGIKTAPAIVLDKVEPEDEIRFNQLHNGCDFDSGSEQAQVGPGEFPFKYEMVPAAALKGNMRSPMANVRGEICKLMQRYGNWGACVATMSGEVIHAAQYTLACIAMGIPCRTYRIPDDDREDALEMLGRKYGVFSYEHLERKTYIQTFAQMMRLRETGNENGRVQKSTLYETRMLPKLRAGERVLDFGCGQGDYVRMLRGKGVAIHGIEFFFRSGRQIDAGAVHKQIDAAMADIKANGLFDVVICDSVLNSVDSLQAEADVLACVNAFCRPGGRIYFSGRMTERIHQQDRLTKNANMTRVRYVEFLDEHGFTALFRDGNWFYQKFHTEQQAVALAARYIGEPNDGYQHTTTSWSIGGTKTANLPDEEILAALEREFNLVWPNGRTVGRGEAVQAAWLQARSVTPQTANSDRLCTLLSARQTLAAALGSQAAQRPKSAKPRRSKP